MVLFFEGEMWLSHYALIHYLESNYKSFVIYEGNKSILLFNLMKVKNDVYLLSKWS